MVKMDALKCLRCDNVWPPRSFNNLPVMCPKCKSPYWNRHRKNKKNSIKNTNSHKTEGFKNRDKTYTSKESK